MKRLNKISFLILVLFVILLIPQAQFSMSAVGENCCEDDECGQCQECDGADIDCPGEYEEGYGTCEIAPDGVCSGCTQGTCGCVCDDGNCRADCSSAPACCGQCESCDGTYCVAQDSNSCDTCSSGSCECRAGRCVDSYSGMAAYKFKNEYDILGLEHESINRFACSGLLGVNIIDDGSGFMQIGGSETCCDPGEVICGFKGDTDGENEIDDMKCCPVEASQGGTITIQKVDSWVDPEGRNTEGTCGYNTVAICGAQHGNDGLDRLKCAYIEIDGTTAPWIGFEVAFRDVDENEEVFCPGGTGGPPPRPPPPCEERSDSECQVEGPTSDCRLCPTPNQNKYAYNFSDINPNTVVTGGSACVNITNDPFNCGQCGFNPGGTSTVYSGNQGFCPSDRPFCVGSCVGRGGASFGVNPSSNPYFYYEVVKNGDLYHSVWGDGSSSSNPIYLSHDINQYENICQAAIGSAADFVDGLGCCGDGKCRELTGMKCNVGAVCDGAIWHDVRDPSIEGEVFKAPACGGEIHNYPIANLNNMFVKCVDADRIVRYIQSHNYQLCVPEYAFNAYPDYYTANPVWRITGPNENIAGIDGKLTGGRAYVCGQEMYQIGGHSGRFTNRNSCPGHPIYGWTIVPETDLVCDVKPDTATSTYVFAAVVDTTKTVFDTGDDGNPPGREGYEICPAPVLDWRELSGNAYVEPRESIAVLPCPGRISLSEFDNLNLEHKTPGGGTWSVSYGKTDWRMVELCKARATPDENIGYYKLPGLFYYFSNGTIMGEVENNSYACFTDETMTPGNQEPARAKIGVCCGDDGCTDIPGTIGEGGVEFSPGQYINASGRILFCLGDGSWSMDMDNESLQDSCTNAGFLATGRYCCAEQDDTSLWINESYSDLNSSAGACFKGTPQYNGNSLIYNDVEYQDVFVFNGSMFGCGFNDSLFEPEYEQGETLCEPDNNGVLSHECLQDIEDWPNPGTGGNDTRTSTPAIKQAGYCTLLETPGANYYCSFDNTWNYTLEDLSHASVVPKALLDYLIEESGDPDLQPSNCCLPNYCWDPNPLIDGCIPEQIGAALAYDVNETTVYKCLQGHWINVLSEGKRTPDGCEVGYCPETNQCLYDIHGNPDDNNNVSPGANPQCIMDEQYKEDFVCENGVWTSRTKKLALKLVSLIDDNDNFVLMCAPSDEVLVSEMLSNPDRRQNTGATNNFCVLNLNPSPGTMTGQRILGTTLNQPLYDPDQHMDFLFALEDSYLRSYPGNSVDLSDCYNTDNFDKCFDDNYLKFYYDDEYKMIIFSNEDVSGLSGGLGSTICNALPSWLQWLCPSPPALEKNLEKLQLFNKVYTARNIDGYSTRTVFGIAEDICETPLEAKAWHHTFNYTGFSSIDLGYLVYYVDAENATITQNQNNIFIKKPNPKIDVWTALTLLRNPEQE